MICPTCWMLFKLCKKMRKGVSKGREVYYCLHCTTRIFKKTK